ncbi:MAG: hypothetical protein GWO16_14990 [Gammaproteobacteria bacterium]|nr:hypothetical protein [Gammaproteobacteria bacterium]NIR99257.1 hypothetical protein [Gammaproteobacteria bacterium]NIT64878.1 hypothetical protein [Gammaproteobacteria bacterium]NIV21828.1 hypothetical protein [Gammaproteobacteria bacterium]NIX10897.1 hypothetical protein [Gammaproteobacteria bacterium]
MGVHRGDAHLADGGIYLLNVVDAYADPLLVKAIVKTLRRELEHVHVWLEREPAPEPPKRITFVISATDTGPPPVQVAARRGFRRTWRPVTGELLARGTPLSDPPVLRDDFVPVERLVRALFHEPPGNRSRSQGSHRRAVRRRRAAAPAPGQATCGGLR